MKRILIIFTISVLFSCANERPATGALTDFIPGEPAVILQMQNPDLFFSNLKNNDFLKLNSDHALYNQFQKDLEILQFFPHSKEALLILNPEGENSLDFLFISRDKLKPEDLDSIPNRQVETLSSAKLEVKKYLLEGKTAYVTQIDSIYMLSNSQELLRDAARGNLNPDPDLQTTFKAASKKQNSVFINSDNAAPFLKRIFPSHFSKFSKWTVLDTDISKDDIRLNGISIASDTIPRLINVFKHVGTSPNNLVNITPVTGRELISICFSNFEKLSENLTFLRGKNSEVIASEEFSLLQLAVEAGTMELSSGKVLALHSLDPDSSRNSLNFELKTVEDYRGTSIFEYPNSRNFQEILQPLLNPEELRFLAFLDDYILFAENPEALKEVIAAVADELVLANSEAYKASSENLSSEASLLIVKNNQSHKISGDQELDYTNYPITAIQYIYQDNFAHLHAILAKSEALKTEKATSQAAEIKLGAAIDSRPVFFKNHRSKGMDIAVQDIQNTLYLISPEGKIYWKKNMDSRILGDIQTVDILRNGRYQLAFATQNALHVIDRDGNPVKPFPLKFRDDITQPLAIFDYDNKRDYRLVITQGRELLMYDRKGKAVKGFNFSKTRSTITQTPKHIRLGRKDYIVVPETSGTLNILSRTGKTRVAVKENLDFSEDEWYEYNGNFVSINSSGQILKVSESGTVKKEDLGLADNTRITATEKTLVTLSENELSIRGNVATLDFGLYSAPQIFYLNDKTYVSVTDMQTNKVFLFDSNAALLEGFPVFGTSLIDLSNADEDPALELVVQGEEEGVLVYEIQ